MDDIIMTEMAEVTNDEIEDSSNELIEGVSGEPETVSNSDDNSEGDEKTEEQDEVIVTIGDEEAPPQEEPRAPEWVRELRKNNREKERRIRELEAKLESVHAENKPATLGPKPKLEDFDYDESKFEAAIDDWHDRKRIFDQEAEKKKQLESKQLEEWQSTLESYGSARKALKVPDFEDAEHVIQEFMDVTQQGIIVQGSENPALVVYALGKNPKKAQEIASIKDPVKFAFTVAKLEKDLKVTNRKSAPPPEKTVKGTGRISGSVDSTLNRLREEAARTGDMTKVVEYKRQQKRKSA